MAPQRRSARVPVATGIYRDENGHEIQACVQGVRGARRFPLDWPLERLLDARADLREELRAKARKQARRRLPKDALGVVAREYLKAVAAMPSIASRRSQIAKWVDALGDRRVVHLTPLVLQQQLATWAIEGVSPSYLRKLHTALSELFSTLYRDSANPMATVKRPTEPDPLPRAIPVHDLVRILRHYPLHSKMKARHAAMAASGLGQSELMRLRPEDVDLEAGLVIARARRKGRGSKARTVPMTRYARAAWRMFVAVDAFGTFATSNLRRSFRAAAQAAGYVLRDEDHPDGLDWRPYDARHTFGSSVGLAGDERAVQELLGHRDLRTTARYTMRSVTPRVAAAIEAMDGQGRKVGRKSGVQNVQKGPNSQEEDTP